MAEVKFTFSREEVEAAWQDATGKEDSLSDANWRKFVLNARKYVDVNALLSACGVIEGGSAACGGGGGGGAGAPASCDYGSTCNKEGCSKTHIVRGALASTSLVADNLSWCAIHRKWHSDDNGVFCLNRGWDISSEAMASRIKEFEYAPVEMRRVMVATGVMKASGYNAGEMKAGGYTLAELKAGGYNAGEMKAGGCTLAELKAGDYTYSELRAGGYTYEQLKAVGF